MTPMEESRKEIDNKVWRNLYPEFVCGSLTPTFSIGDHVRITKKKKTLIKDTLKDGLKRVLQFQKFK